MCMKWLKWFHFVDSVVDKCGSIRVSTAAGFLCPWLEPVVSLACISFSTCDYAFPSLVLLPCHPPIITLRLSVFPPVSFPPPPPSLMWASSPATSLCLILQPTHHPPLPHPALHTSNFPSISLVELTSAFSLQFLFKYSFNCCYWLCLLLWCVCGDMILELIQVVHCFGVLRKKQKSVSWVKVTEYDTVCFCFFLCFFFFCLTVWYRITIFSVFMSCNLLWNWKLKPQHDQNFA